MLREKDIYDERQMQIFGSIHKRSFKFTILAFLINGFVNGFGLLWASVFYQHLVIIVLCTTFYTIQCIIYGVLFGRHVKYTSVIMLLWTFFGTLFGSLLGYFILTTKQDENALLSDAVCGIIVSAILSVNIFVALIKYLLNYEKKQKEDSRDDR